MLDTTSIISPDNKVYTMKTTALKANNDGKGKVGMERMSPDSII